MNYEKYRFVILVGGKGTRIKDFWEIIQNQ